MKAILTSLLFFLISSLSYSQCFPPTSLFTNNVNYYNAGLNWNSVSGAHHYKIRIKEITATSWQYINNIDSLLNSRTVSNLVPLSDYVWQIKTYCDSTNTSISSWSVADTFTTTTSSCPNTGNLFITNINHNNALANWDTVFQANRYKLRYRVLGGSSWSNLGPIYHPTNNVTIPLLQPTTTYEWQILTFHDSTILLGSLWSPSDTFTTTAFIAAPFNPIITNTLSSLECATSVELYLQITQETNEPDIGSGSITSDGGYFDLSSVSMGDSVGYAIMTTATQSIEAVLRVALILGQNYAIINSYDSTGSLVGLFTIENENGGIKVEVPGSPNDGNNYTSGYVSELYFTNLFVNPASAGPLQFFANISSELNDLFSSSETVQIWCNTTGLAESNTKKRTIVGFYDMLGRKLLSKPNSVHLVKFSDEKIEKRFFIE